MTYSNTRGHLKICEREFSRLWSHDLNYFGKQTVRASSRTLFFFSPSNLRSTKMQKMLFIPERMLRDLWEKLKGDLACYVCYQTGTRTFAVSVFWFVQSATVAFGHRWLKVCGLLGWNWPVMKLEFLEHAQNGWGSKEGPRAFEKARE